MATNQPVREWDKFDEEAVEKTQNGNTWDTVHRVTKGIFAVILFSFVMFSAVVSKMAVLILTSNIAVPNKISVVSLKTWNNHLAYRTHNIGKTLNKKAFVTNISHVWALFIILISPYIGTVIHLFWKLSLRRFSNCKIEMKHLIVEVLISTIHTVGLCLLVFCLVPSVDPLTGVLFCNLVFYLPSLIRFTSILLSKKLAKVWKATVHPRSSTMICYINPYLFYYLGIMPISEVEELFNVGVHIIVHRDRSYYYFGFFFSEVEVYILLPRLSYYNFGFLFSEVEVYILLPRLFDFPTKKNNVRRGPLLASYCIAVVLSIITFILPLVMFCLLRQKQDIHDPGDGHIALYVFVPIMISVEWIWTLVPEDSIPEGKQANGAKNTTTPSDNQPTTPSDNKPTTPSDNKPTTSSDNKPTTPSDNKPTTPSDNQPTKPSDIKPTTPSDNQPTTPSDNKPTTPSDNQSSHGSDNAVPQVHDEDSGKWMPKFSRLKHELHDQHLPIYLIVNTWRIVVSFCTVLIIFSAGCDEGNTCINALFGTKEQAFLSSRLIGPTLIDGDAYSDPFTIAVITILASYVCYKTCVVAVKICLEICFVVPLCMSSVVTTILVIVLFYRTDNSFVQFGFPSWQGLVEADFHLGHVLCLSLGIPLLCLYCIPILRNRTERMLSENRIFFKASYCGVLLDQSMVLNRWIHQCDTDEETTTGRTPAASIEEGTENRESMPADDNIPTTVPKIYLCATMWHEESKEMEQLLTSILRLEKDQWKKKRFDIEVGDIIDFEVHVLFDDAFRYDEYDDANANEYVADFREAVKDASSHVYGSRVKLDDPNAIDTPYGQQLHYNLPLGAKMVVHLKDKRKIRIKKRWSQVMYMYYLLAYKTKPTDLDNVYILALDGDVDFQPCSLYLLSQRMTANKDVGAACGRIHAIGSGPMIWYQKFEYAVSHWLQKATEHVTGSILCGPGCFTLFRGSALADLNVAKTYTRMPTEAKHFLQYDLGEDRWLCTLLLKQGKKLEYIAASDSYTYAPEGFKAFFKQRKRWGPSTMANILDLLMDTRTVTKNNSSISKLYMMYQLFLFITSILTPGTIFLMILGATKLAYPGISLTMLLVANLVPVVLFVLACLFGKSELQLKLAAVLSVMYSLVMMIVLVGLFQQGVDKGTCSVTVLFTIFVGGVFLTTALLHPKEYKCVIFGLLYFLVTPSMQMLLIIYSIANLNNVSWGTRESPNQSQHAEGTLGSVLGYLRRCFKCENEPTSTIEKTQNKNVSHQNIDQTGWSSTTSIQVKSKEEPSEDFRNGSPNILDDVETTFWNEVIQEYLQPAGVADPASEERAKKSLKNLRNKMTLAFLLSNAFFVTVVFYLQKMNEDADRSYSIQLPCGEGEDIEPIGIAFTAVFGIMLFIQYICMLSHRWKTFLVIMANTSVHKKGDWKVVEEEIDTALKEGSLTGGNNLERDAMDFIKREKTVISDEDGQQGSTQSVIYTRPNSAVIISRPPTEQRLPSRGGQCIRPKTGRQRIMEDMRKNSDQNNLISANRTVCEKFGITEEPRNS